MPLTDAQRQKAIDSGTAVWDILDEWCTSAAVVERYGDRLMAIPYIDLHDGEVILMMVRPGRAPFVTVFQSYDHTVLIEYPRATVLKIAESMLDHLLACDNDHPPAMAADMCRKIAADDPRSNPHRN